MTTHATTGNTPSVGRSRYLFLAAAVLAYLLVTMGGIVCASGAARGCPDWPGCYGRVLPPARLDAVIEFLHRFIAALTAPVLIAAAVVGWRRYRGLPWVSRPPAVAIVFTAAVVVFGALAVLRGLKPGVAAVDFGSALTVLALLSAAAVAAFSHHANPGLSGRLYLGTPFARLAAGALVTVFVLFVSGIFASGSGSLTRCLGWPLYGGGLVAADAGGWLQTARLLLAGISALLLAAIIIEAWRTQRARPAIPAAATAAGVLFVVEALLGVLLSVATVPLGLLMLYVALAAAVWALLVALVVLAGLTAAAPAGDRVPFPGRPGVKLGLESK